MNTLVARVILVSLIVRKNVKYQKKYEVTNFKMKLSTSSKKILFKYFENIRRPKSKTIDAVLFAPSYKCQCSCVHCGIALQRQKQKKELGYNEIMKLIDEVSRLGAKKLFFLGGEPLLVPELAGYISYARKKGLKTRIETNGRLLNERLVKKLKKAGLNSLGVSIDSPFETVHDQLRGVKGTFKKAIAGIRYCKKYKIDCYMTTYVTKKSLRNGEAKQTVALAKRLRVILRVLSPVLVGRWLNRKDLALSCEDISLLRNLLKKDKIHWENELIDSKELPFFCSAMNKLSFFISPYGDIQPCIYVPVSFGNIKQEPLGKIIKKMWSSRIFSKLKYGKYRSCPFNNKAFVKKISGVSGAKVQYHRNINCNC